MRLKNKASSITYFKLKVVEMLRRFITVCRIYAFVLGTMKITCFLGCGAM
jgi:hypothetical protein